jgi:hypothetical protein
MPTEIDWARLAAYIDGEGCVDIVPAGRNFHATHHRRPQLQVRIQIGNTDPRLPVWCKENFGGSTRLATKQNPKWRASMYWIINSAKAVEILKNCYPYFLLKREQAEIAIAFQKTVTRPGVKGYPDSVHDYRHELSETMKALKVAPDATKSVSDVH